MKRGIIMKRSVSSLGLLRAGRKIAVLALIGSTALAASNATATAHSRAAGNPPALVACHMAGVALFTAAVANLWLTTSLRTPADRRPPQ